MITEKLFQFIWQHKLFDTTNLVTTDSEKVTIIHVGYLNHHAGPDFFEAKIKIGTTTWIGHVELHLKTSDWIKHLHQFDDKYKNVILHVVMQHDCSLKDLNTYEFPTLMLNPHINNSLLERYSMLMTDSSFLACQNQLSTIKKITFQVQLDKVLIERLEDKTSEVKSCLETNHHNWQEVFYIQIAKSFGLHINQYAFEQLARIVPLSILMKHKHNVFQLEALLFGQAGLLADYFDEPYPLQLQQEYSYLQKLYKLQSIDKSLWKFLRLRPANFPTIRIAQFAQLLLQSSQLFSKILEANTVSELYQLFEVEASEFWHNHYTFHHKVDFKVKSMGKNFIQLIIINAIIPTLFIYGKLQAKELYCEKALQFLTEIPFEQNSITNAFRVLSFPHQSASDSQAILQLKKNYCDVRRCLECGIGFALINQQRNL